MHYVTRCNTRSTVVAHPTTHRPSATDTGSISPPAKSRPPEVSAVAAVVTVARFNDVGGRGVVPGAEGIAVEWLSSVHCKPGTITIDYSKIVPATGALEFKTRFPNALSRGGIGTAVWTCIVQDGQLQVSTRKAAS